MSTFVRLAPLSGAAFAFLFGVGSGLWVFDQPVRDASSRDVRGFFEGSSTEILIGGTLSIASFVFLVWFGAVVRDRLDQAHEGRTHGLASVSFAGTVLLGAVGLAAETINMAAAMSAEDAQLTDESSQVFFDLTYAFGAHAAGVAVAAFALPIGITAVSTGRILSPWSGWILIAFGALMLTPALLNRTAFLVLYALTVALFAVLSLHLWRESNEARAPL